MHCDHTLGGWDSRRLFRQGWSCALWVATLLEELVCLPSWKGRAGSQVPSGSLRLSGSAYFACASSQPQPGLLPHTCGGWESKGWYCRQRSRGGTRILFCHSFSSLLELSFKISCITLGGKKNIQFLCFFLGKAAYMNNTSMFLQSWQAMSWVFVKSAETLGAVECTWQRSAYS